MQKLLIILILAFHCSSAQLYVSWRSNLNYVEIFPDSAHVEVFKTQCRIACVTKYIHNETLFPKRSGDTIFAGPQTSILKKKGFIILCYKNPYKNKFSNVDVFRTLHDNRDSLRKPAYYHLRKEQVCRLWDSLSLYPTKFTSWVSRIDQRTGQYTLEEYKTMIAQKFDSVAAILIKNKDPKVDAFYRKADSLNSLDSATVFGLLSRTKYDLYSGQFLLRKAAKERPGLLLHYLEKKPANKDTLLRSIKYGRFHEEILTSIKAAPGKSHIKKEIIRQHRALLAGEVAAAVLYIFIIVAEFTLLFLLFKWIFGGF